MTMAATLKLVDHNEYTFKNESVHSTYQVTHALRYRVSGNKISSILPTTLLAHVMEDARHIKLFQA